MSMLRTSFLRATRASAPRSLRPFTPQRNYAEKKDMSAIPGDQTPQAAGNVKEGGTMSAELEGKSTASGVGAESAPDTKSVQSPIDNPKGASTGQQEDGTSTQKTFKQDPDKPAEEKRKNVEEQGQKPLDAANK